MSVLETSPLALGTCDGQVSNVNSGINMENNKLVVLLFCNSVKCSSPEAETRERESRFLLSQSTLSILVLSGSSWCSD